MYIASSPVKTMFSGGGVQTSTPRYLAVARGDPPKTTQKRVKKGSFWTLFCMVHGHPPKPHGMIPPKTTQKGVKKALFGPFLGWFWGV